MTKDTVRPAELRDLPGFKGFPRRPLDLLSRSIKAFHVKKGEVIFRPGQPAEDLFLMMEGEVGLSLSGSRGRFVRLVVLTEGEFFGVSALIPGWRRVSHATALRDSRIGEIPARSFVNKVCGIPWEGFSALTEMTLKPFLLASLRRALFLVEDLSNRVALALWEYASHPEAQRRMGILPSSLTHEEVSAVVGASRPRVSLVLKQLEEKGFFVRKGKSLQVQEEALSAYLRREYEFLL